MPSIITLPRIYLLIGIILCWLVVLTLRDKHHPKRLTTALFWGLFAIAFLADDALVQWFGPRSAHQFIGIVVIVMALLAGCGQVTLGNYRQHSEQQKQVYAAKFKNRLFLPAIAIPILTVIATIGLKGVSIAGFYILDQHQLTLAALSLACCLSLLMGWKITGSHPLQAIAHSRRLLDSVGWAIVLPQMLAMLGGIFVAAHTGDAVKMVVSLFVQPDNRLLLVVLYCVGMALFSMIMGNAFAAFPVLSAGIAVPLLIHGQHANPAPLLAIGMYAGYCGTLLTPMAANFNIVPAALLELKDKYQVIKIQAPTAILLLVVNIGLIYFLAF
jgi:uncharacterized membrane protein